MSEEKLIELYFKWIINLITDEDHSSHFINKHYLKLLNCLFVTDFSYILPMDANRYDDGIDLRYRFGYEEDHPDGAIATYIDRHPCSVLEMMVALAYRCAEQICYDPDNGPDVGWLFWEMIDNLCLTNMTNDRFDYKRFEIRMDMFLNRLYSSDGTGNLFKFDLDFLNKKHFKQLRHTEIWYQMHLYLDYISQREERTCDDM